MTFLSAGLLAGLLATGLPVALHLLARQQPKRVIFPATRFLKPSLHTHRDRLIIRRWWLLAMRILTVALLAITLARPQIHIVTSEAWLIVGAIAVVGIALFIFASMAVIGDHAKALRYGLAIAGLLAMIVSASYAGVTFSRAPSAIVNDSSPAAVAIVIDNSIRASRLVNLDGQETSMPASASNSESTSILDAMRDVAKWFVGEQTSDSLVAILDRTPRPATFSIDQATAVSRIERTLTTTQTMPLVERVRSAIALVRSSELERKSVLLITDLTTPSYDEKQWEAASLRALLEEEPAVTLQVYDVGSESKANLSIGQVEIGDPTPPRLAKTDLSVVINTPTATSSESSRSLNVQLDLYDLTSPAAAGMPVVRDSKTVLPPLKSVDRATIETSGNATKVLLSVPPLEIGTHHGVIRLNVEDELRVDNERYVTFVVSEPRRVLIVGGSRDEANVLAGAITAPLAMDDPLAEYTIEISEFTPSDRELWKRFSAVILIDPPTPTPPARTDREMYLASGGHLLSLLGPATNKPDESSDTFPAGIARVWRVPSPGTFLEITRPSHPSVDSLREIAGGVPWGAFRVSQYWQLRPSESDVVIARYAGTDHPAIVERTSAATEGVKQTFGGGVHLICTTPLPALADSTRNWNQLFSGADAWPAFLLFRDMVDSLVYRDRSIQNLLVGQSTRLSVGGNENGQAGEESTRRLQLFPPAEPPVPMVAENDTVTLSQLATPGTYWLKSKGQVTGVSVNLQESETDLSRIDPSLFDQWLGGENYFLVRSRDEIRQAEGRGQPTRSLYAVALMLMLAAFVFEQILSNRFYASRADQMKASVAT